MKQLHANMVHFGTQVMVKALKEHEIIDFVTVYELVINYEKKVGTRDRLTIDLNHQRHNIEGFGQFTLKYYYRKNII